jgi:hypothetical protein
MKYDHKNLLKLQIATYLEESLSMVGKMMVNDLFDQIENLTDDEGQAILEAHYDNNIFDLIAPYLQHASEEYEAYSRTEEGKSAMNDLKKAANETKRKMLEYNETLKNVKPSNEGNGNVH